MVKKKRILIEITHPAHYHFYKNAIKELKMQGHKVLVTARDKDVLIDLLKKDKIKYILLSKLGGGKFGVYWEFLKREYKLFKVARKFNPDVITGLHNPAVAHVAWLLRKKSIVFSDSEPQSFMEKITLPFVSIFCTPSCFEKDLGEKHLRYRGYHEFAYLHPKRFVPNKNVLKKYNLTEKKYAILRLVSWQAYHDFGEVGIKNIKELLVNLNKEIPTFINAEKNLSKELGVYNLKVNPEDMHSLLAYAAIYIGEGATMASEAAILGTPAIYINSLKLGYTNELDRKYKLVYNLDSDTPLGDIIKRTKKVLRINKGEISKRRNVLLKDKIDVTEFLVNLLTQK
jgi:uncharacterized protein